MARLDVSRSGGSLDIGSLDLSDEQTKEALYAGTNLLADKTRAAAQQLNIKGYSTGETARHTAVKYYKTNKNNIYVTFEGERKRGRTTTRYGAIAFYNEYGVKSHGTPARNWIKKTNDANEAAVVDAMARVVFKEDKNT